MSLARGLDPNQAVKSYFKDQTWWTRSAVGGMCNVGAFILLCLHQMFIPIAFGLVALSIGYNLRVMRVNTAAADASLPGWNDWVDLFISGLTWIAVFFGQVLIVISVATVALLIGSGAGLLNATANSYLLWAAVMVGSVSIAWLGVSFFSCLLMANFAEKEKTVAAFDLVSVFKHLSKDPLQFLQAWLIAVGLQWLSVIVPIASIIGIMLLPQSTFVAGNISAILFAQVWAATEESA